MAGDLIPAHHGALMGGAAAWWDIAGQTCIAAWQAKGAASLAASYVNLANPGTYDAAPGVAPTFDAATGWTFAGGQYLLTSLIPTIDQTWSMIVRIANATPQTYSFPVAGRSGSNEYFGVASHFTSTSRIYMNGVVGYRLVAGAVTAGRMAYRGRNCYLNGVTDGTMTVGVGTTCPALYIGARNNDGSPQFYFVGDILALAIYPQTLTEPELLALDAAVAAL